MDTHPEHEIRRRTRLSTKVVAVWIIIAGLYLAHRTFPASVSEWAPVAALFLSRLFLWPAFPRVSRIAWPVFWIAQLLIFVQFISGVTLTALFVATLILSSVVTFGMFAFLLVSDAVLVCRDYQQRRATFTRREPWITRGPRKARF